MLVYGALSIAASVVVVGELAVCAVVASASSAASTATSPLTALLAAGTLFHFVVTAAATCQYSTYTVVAG
jgi:hypothetical protein